MRKGERVFWKLLRAGLWHDASFVADMPHIDEGTWAEVRAIAKNTGTTALVADGIVLLPSDNMPSAALAKELIRYTMNLSKIHLKHNAAVYKLFKFLDSIGVHATLLKGQGLSLFYKAPDRRLCGDIDIYIGSENMDKVVSAFTEKGFTCEEEMNDTEKHVSFFLEKIIIELHRYSTHLDNPKSDAKYQQWWNDEMKDNANGFYVTLAGKISAEPIEGARFIPLPAAEVNTFFVFYHLFHHYIGKEVQFKQFADFALCLYANKGKIDDEKLARKIDELGLSGIWSLFGCFLHHYLGLPVEYIPKYKEYDAKRLDRFVDRLREKCFYPHSNVKKHKRPKNRFAGKIYSFYYHVKAASEIFNIFPKDGLYYVFSTIKSGTKLFFSNKNRRGTLDHYIHRLENEKDK